MTLPASPVAHDFGVIAELIQHYAPDDVRRHASQGLITATPAAAIRACRGLPG